MKNVCFEEVNRCETFRDIKHEFVIILIIIYYLIYTSVNEAYNNVCLMKINSPFLLVSNNFSFSRKFTRHGEKIKNGILTKSLLTTATLGVGTTKLK